MKRAGTASATSLPRIAWVTNASAPYRRPVWADVARQSTLHVGLLSENLPNRRWDPSLPDGVLRLPLRCVAPTISGLPMYVVLRAGIPLRQVDALILPGWETPAAWQLLALAKLRGVATVAFYESLAKSHRFSRGPVALLRRVFFRAAGCVLTVGDASTQAALAFGVPRERVVTTYNAVDVKRINTEAARAGGEGVGRRHRLIYVGQLISRKNVDGLLRALATLPGETTLAIAGEGREESALRSLASELGVAGRVDFLGYVPHDDIAALLATASTLVLPSHQEVYGLVVNEALAAGLHAVVSEDCGVLPDVRDMTGVYEATDDPASLAAAVARSMDAWTGPIIQPAVLDRTPEVMASDVMLAVRTARSRARRRA